MGSSMIRHGFLAVLWICAPSGIRAQVDVAGHQIAANRLIDAALRDSAAYRRLAMLTDRFGHRMTGSRSLEQAIDWIVAEMRRDGLDSVYTEPVKVTHWVRGAESATLVSPRRVSLPMLGLGRSVGTPAAGITAPVLVVRDFADLRARASEARGKIVLFDFPFDTALHPAVAYGQAVQYRAYGADSSAALGAVATLVRSATPSSLRTPHTGALSHTDTLRQAPSVPAAALSVEDTEMLHRMQRRGDRIVVTLKMEARTLPDGYSRNVVAEIHGSERPDEVVVLGGHIDSWDVGQGAMDDAGGSVAAWEALRLIRQFGGRPKRTIRVVLWTAEEIGLSGALAYRDAHVAELERHIAVMESDGGVFRPFGVFFAGSDSGLTVMRQVTRLLRRIGADSVLAGGPEADAGPLVALGVPGLTLGVDPSRYFWYHHTEADTVDKLDPADMARCVAVMAVVAYTLANMEGRIPGPSASPQR